MTSPVAKITDELEAKVAVFVKEHRLPGAAVGVVHGDDLVWSAGVGFADVASRRAPLSHESGASVFMVTDTWARLDPVS